MQRPSKIILTIVAIASMAILAGCGFMDRGQDVTGFWQNQDRKGAGKL